MKALAQPYFINKIKYNTIEQLESGGLKSRIILFCFFILSFQLFGFIFLLWLAFQTFIVLVELFPF
jgi:hypothetical protein